MLLYSFSWETQESTTSPPHPDIANTNVDVSTYAGEADEEDWSYWLSTEYVLLIC